MLLIDDGRTTLTVQTAFWPVMLVSAMIWAVPSFLPETFPVLILTEAIPDASLFQRISSLAAPKMESCLLLFSSTSTVSGKVMPSDFSLT